MRIGARRRLLRLAIIASVSILGSLMGCVGEIVNDHSEQTSDSDPSDGQTLDQVSDSGASDEQTIDVAVTVSPASLTVATNGAQQFTATVTGSGDTTVHWSVDEASGCGQISSDGLYTAPATAGRCHVTATSVADPTRSDTAVVDVRVFFYVSPTGSDVEGDGSLPAPWASLYKATSTVDTPGSVIYVMAGEYVETKKCELAAGVSIIGDGDASHIISHFETIDYNSGFISLTDPLAEGIDGSQSISYLKLDGDLIGTIAIFVLGRSNVKIHHCTIVDFTDSGIGFRGAYPGPMPTVFATGNEIHDCIIENSSTRGGVSCGLIRTGGQDGMLVHDNLLIQDSRDPGENGNIFNSWGTYEKGLKYYNNLSIKPSTDGIIQASGKGWNFHIEAGSTLGGMEIYNNEFRGGCAIDIAHISHVKGDYDYSWWVHDNTFMLDAQIAEPPAGTHGPEGVAFEGTTEDAIVNNNYFVNLPMGVTLDIGQDERHDSNIKVFYNVFDNMGYSDSGWTFIFTLNAYKSDNIIENIYYYNNVIRGTARAAFFLSTSDTIRNIYIRNNIIENITTYGWLTFWDGPGTIDSIYVQNNIIFNNVNDNAVYYRSGKTVTNLVGYEPGVDIDGNLNVDPQFISDVDFHLQVGSLGLNAGQDLDLESDFAHAPVDDTPNIGAFE